MIGLPLATCTGLAVIGGAVAASDEAVEAAGDQMMQEIENKVAADAVEQYEIAKESGSGMDRCAQAGMVVAAFLQAKDRENYKKWKAIEGEDCKAVGAAVP